MLIHDKELVQNFFNNVLDSFKGEDVQPTSNIKWSEISSSPNSSSSDEKVDEEEFLISAVTSSVVVRSANGQQQQLQQQEAVVYVVISNLADIHLVGGLRSSSMIQAQQEQVCERKIPADKMCQMIVQCCYSNENSTSSTDNSNNKNSGDDLLEQLMKEKSSSSSSIRGTVTTTARNQIQRSGKESHTCKLHLFSDGNIDRRHQQLQQQQLRQQQKGKLVFKVVSPSQLMAVSVSFELEAELFDVHDLLGVFHATTSSSSSSSSSSPSTASMFLNSSASTAKNHRHLFVREYFIRPLLKQLSVMRSVAAAGFRVSCLVSNHEGTDDVLNSLRSHRSQLLQQQAPAIIANNLARMYVNEAVKILAQQDEQPTKSSETKTTQLFAENNMSVDDSKMSTSSSPTLFAPINELARHIQFEFVQYKKCYANLQQLGRRRNRDEVDEKGSAGLTTPIMIVTANHKETRMNPNSFSSDDDEGGDLTLKIQEKRKEMERKHQQQFQEVEVQEGRKKSTSGSAAQKFAQLKRRGPL